MDATTMEAACASTQRVVDRIDDRQLDLPTPCSEWTVGQLLQHIVGTLHLGDALLGDHAPAEPMMPGALPEGDVLNGDFAKAYRAGVEALLATAQPDTFARVHTTPLGEMPGVVLGGFTTLDILVHGWDLARATGQDTALDDDLAGEVLAFAEATITSDTRAPRIGPPVAIAASAPVGDRLVAFLGRTL